MNVLVVDDEALARERLARLVARVKPGVCCLQATGGEVALAQIAEYEPELVLLDIRMPGMDGIEVAARIGAMPDPPAVIFCTAYDEYALDALRHEAVAYLLKPVREADLRRALDSAARVNRVQLASLRALEAGPAGGARTQVSTQTHRGIESLPLAEVRCFIAEDKYVTAYSPRGSLVLPDTLKDLETEFSDRFLRVHRNALVALEHIESLQHDTAGGWHLFLNAVEQRPQVSRRHIKQVKARLLMR
ncbi:MAG: LytTR family DNA-binding domain-containing protein [Halioglobus sp.]|nr:LytTR family DNA-binding domain-containing protein [Halioglobus sp.]